MEEFRTRAADGDKMAKERLQHPAICHRLEEKMASLRQVEC
jgi:hypothetical protein